MSDQHNFKHWLYAPDAIIDASLITGIQLLDGWVSEYEYTETDKLHDHPVRLLIQGKSDSKTSNLMIDVNPKDAFVSMNYYGDDIQACLDCLEESNVYEKSRVDVLRSKAISMQKSYDDEMKAIMDKRAESESIT